MSSRSPLLQTLAAKFHSIPPAVTLPVIAVVAWSLPPLLFVTTDAGKAEIPGTGQPAATAGGTAPNLGQGTTSLAPVMQPTIIQPFAAGSGGIAAGGAASNSLGSGGGSSSGSGGGAGSARQKLQPAMQGNSSATSPGMLASRGDPNHTGGNGLPGSGSGISERSNLPPQQTPSPQTHPAAAPPLPIHVPPQPVPDPPPRIAPSSPPVIVLPMVPPRLFGLPVQPGRPMIARPYGGGGGGRRR